jgi:hypothetical protein
VSTGCDSKSDINPDGLEQMSAYVDEQVISLVAASKGGECY